MADFLRIFHIDWNFVSSRRDYLTAWLERVAALGYNAILWEVEDKVAWDALGNTVWPEAMTKAEFRELLDYAAKLGLEAIPLLQTVGHGEYVMKHDRFRHLRERPDRHDCYCTEKPETRQLLKTLISEYLEVFGDIRRFHLGGDEAYVFASCPVCQEKAARIGRNGLYMEHMQDLAAVLLQRGIRPGIWCDMILAHPEEMGAVPTTFEVWDWNYGADGQPSDKVRIWGKKGMAGREDIPEDALKAFPEIVNPDGSLNRLYTADALKRLGFSTILCSASRSGGDSIFCPRVIVHDPNVAGLARKAISDGFTGTCVTSWAIRINSWELQLSSIELAPMICANPGLSVADARDAIGRQWFDCDPQPFWAAIEAISSPQFPFSRSASTAIQWNALKDSEPAPANYLRDRVFPGWKESGVYSEELKAAEAAIASITAGKAQLDAFANSARRGFDILHAWAKAADQQLWQARLAKLILSGEANAGLLPWISSLKEDFRLSLASRETPLSAEKSSNLVYDVILEYVANPQ